ncbi:hypothetical protein B5X24_HaOG201831 [Helicoverpa armigera]|nr:hypothetical protein B5X24_HaOG201831 [Helicoverpa armigera]
MFKGKKKGRETNWCAFGPQRMGCRLVVGTKWRVDLPHNIDWIQKLDGKCNCPAFYKNYMCKHIIGLTIGVKLANPPPEAKNLLIGQKRKRGRPSKSKPALIIQ